MNSPTGQVHCDFCGKRVEDCDHIATPDAGGRDGTTICADCILTCTKAIFSRARDSRAGMYQQEETPQIDRWIQELGCQGAAERILHRADFNSSPGMAEAFFFAFARAVFSARGVDSSEAWQFLFMWTFFHPCLAADAAEIASVAKLDSLHGGETPPAEQSHGIS